MNKKTIFELFDYMTTSGKSTFIDDFEGWGTEAEIPGFSSFASCEGNGIRSKATDQTYEPQCENVRRGNHLKVECRSKGCIREISLDTLFPEGTSVVITTGSEQLRKLAPIFEKRSEMMDWLHLVGEYVITRKNAGNPVPWYWEDEMIKLAKYLYENQLNKVNDQSIYDKYVL